MESMTNPRNQPIGENKYLPGGGRLHRQGEAPPIMGIEVDIDDGSEVEEGDEGYWIKRARHAYYSSTDYLDSNYRKSWEDSIRNFNNMHSLDSKYMNPAYAKRSSIFKPKVRSVIRKNEAAAAAAFFSNM